jgi:hypothetical protein
MTREKGKHGNPEIVGASPTMTARKAPQGKPEGDCSIRMAKKKNKPVM